MSFSSLVALAGFVNVLSFQMMRNVVFRHGSILQSSILLRPFRPTAFRMASTSLESKIEGLKVNNAPVKFVFVRGKGGYLYFIIYRLLIAMNS